MYLIISTINTQGHFCELFVQRVRGENFVLRIDMTITENCLNDDMTMNILETFSDRCNISQSEQLH